jgi:hypothetical protein
LIVHASYARVLFPSRTATARHVAPVALPGGECPKERLF